MVLTIAAVAENKTISVTQLSVTVEGRTDFVGRQTKTHFTSEIDLGEGLTHRERLILYNSARQCEVHKMLRGEILFADQLLGSQ